MDSLVHQIVIGKKKQKRNYGNRNYICKKNPSYSSHSKASMNQFSLHIPPQTFGVLPKTKWIKSIISRKTDKLRQFTYQECNATHLEQVKNVFLCVYCLNSQDAEIMGSRMRNLRSIKIRWRVKAWKPCGAFLSTNAGYKMTTWSMPPSSRQIS